MAEAHVQQRTPSADVEVLRVFGYFALITAIACCVLLFANIRARFLFGADNLSFLGYIGAYALIAGFGTIQLTRWGASMLCVPLALVGIVFGVLTVRQQQTVVAIAFAVAWVVLLGVPGLFAIRSWRDLR